MDVEVVMLEVGCGGGLDSGSKRRPGPAAVSRRSCRLQADLLSMPEATDAIRRWASFAAALFFLSCTHSTPRPVSTTH